MKLKTTPVSFGRIEYMIHKLENAIQLCYDVESNDEKGYPYATGYSRVVMKETVLQLREVMNGGN